MLLIKSIANSNKHVNTLSHLKQHYKESKSKNQKPFTADMGIIIFLKQTLVDTFIIPFKLGHK